MGVWDTIKSGASSVGAIAGGQVEKAMLIFQVMSGEQAQKQEVKKNAKAGLGVSIPGVEINLDNLSDALDKAKDMSGIGSMVFGAKNFVLESDDLTFPVQFNPGTLNIRARGGGSFQIANVANKTDGEGKKKGQASSTYTYHAMDPYISIDFTLIFDQTNIEDAFMADKFMLNSQTIRNSIALNKEFTVRPIVEGFLAAVRNEKYRSVVFVWGNMRYGGMMREINTKYTMFSVSGEPIRAEVAVTIQLASTASAGNTEKTFVKEWQDKYKKIMNENKVSVMENGEKIGDSISMGSAVDSWKNLIGF